MLSTSDAGNLRAPSAAGPLGLTVAEAERRLAASGPNEIKRGETTSPWRILAGQFGSPLIWLLLAATVISAVLGEIPDAVAIGVIVVLNALVGFFQEYRAERALLALRSLTAPRTRVLRDGRQVVVAAVEIVPGDLLLLEAGDIVAADARLEEANVLSLNEAALTGESAPAEKRIVAAPKDAPLAERHDSVFMGTSVATGTGTAEVVATGMKTELGKIAHLLATAEDTVTPLQRRLARVSRTLLYLCLAIVAATVVVGLLRGVALMEVFMSAVSLAVAAVPEGLPAVVTIALAIGVRRMAARHVLIRKLPSVETLGSATVICTDKTGTLTTGVMTVRELWGPDHGQVLDAAAACCDAELGPDERTGIGDPTEIALLVSAAERGIRRSEIESTRPRRNVLPFDADRKRMSILRADDVLYVKGAVDLLLPLCTSGTDDALEANVRLAAGGLRVLGVATGSGTDEKQLRLLGLVGIADPPRAEAIAAVASARAAGIRTVMITGDHPVTAGAIAKELGIVLPGDDPAELVHARATPEDKLRIVRSWKERGAVVAAVREGRGIFDNIRKTLVYLLAGNTGELLLMLVAGIAGLPLPLLPLHLLWINLVTDGFPALALVMDPPDPDVLKRPPRPPAEPMLRRAEWLTIVGTGVLEASVTLAVFVWALEARDLTQARNLAFTTLAFGELFRAFAARSTTKLFWEVGAFTNLRLLGVVVVSVLVQLGMHHIPAVEALFQITELSVSDCIMTLLLGLIPVTVLELTKLVRRALRREANRPSGGGKVPA